MSGGPDSLALTALAKAYSLERKSKIYYVLIDHNIRKNSYREAISVKKLLKMHDINLNIIKNKKKIEKNIQGEARDIRYDLLKKYCKKKNINIILTAHNLEDQVETFFIRLSRGSGLQGLSSMTFKYSIERNIYLVRPLLDFQKKQLAKISKNIFKKYIKDPTNSNTKYLRTRIRNLKKHLEKSGINYMQIFKSIKNLASSRDTLEIYFNEIFKNIVKKSKNKSFVHLDNLRSINKEMKIKVLTKLIKDLTKSYYSIRSTKILNLLKQIEVKKEKLNYYLGGCRVFREKNYIVMKKK